MLEPVEVGGLFFHRQYMSQTKVTNTKCCSKNPQNCIFIVKVPQQNWSERRNKMLKTMALLHVMFF